MHLISAAVVGRGLSLPLVEGRLQREPQLDDPCLIDRRDLDSTPLDIDDLSGFGHAPEHLDHVPADGGLAGVLDLDAELVLRVRSGLGGAESE